MNFGFVYGCYAMQKNFEFTKTGGGNAYVGGFVGHSNNLIEHCYSENPVDLNIDTSDTVGVRAGGFAGHSYDARYCYAKGNVSARSKQLIHMGGFAGAVEGNIRFCYATGNVSGFVSGPNYCNIGGFAGWSTANISNCYAVGNVFADRESGSFATFTIGSFVGLQDTNNITNCFAAGTVTAHRYEIAPDAVSNLFSVGGFAGHIGWSQNTASINKSAALGQGVTATGALIINTTTYRRDAGRFFGGVSTNGTASGNYAINTMQLYESDTYGDPRPGETIITNGVHSNQHGADASTSNLRNRDFWFNTLDFSITNWDFFQVGIRGYPRLRDSNGGLLGGQ